MAGDGSFDADLLYAKKCLEIGYALKDHQVEALEALYDGNDTVAVLPTGYGKSVIYQLLPWILQRTSSEPLTVINVTALNSIMQDQVQSLCDNGIAACYLDMCGTKGHTYGKEGKEFRKSFNKLGELTCLYPNVPHFALTATATTEALEDLCKVLQFENQHYIISNPDRANIYLEVRQRLPNIKKYEKIEQILNPIIAELRQKVLDFPLTINYCDNLESIGYSYQYISSELGDLQYVNDEHVPENRVFAQYHKDYTVPMKRHILSELRKKEPTLRLVFGETLP